MLVIETAKLKIWRGPPKLAHGSYSLRTTGQPEQPEQPPVAGDREGSGEVSMDDFMIITMKKANLFYYMYEGDGWCSYYIYSWIRLLL